MAVGSSVSFAYFVTIGGTTFGELFSVLRTVNACVALALIWMYVRRAPRRTDEVDRLVVAVLLLFALATVVAAYPRQAFDAFLGMLTFAALFYVARVLVVRPNVRGMLLKTMMVLAVFTTVIGLIGQLRPMIEWIDLTGGAVSPPLAMPFVATPWGNRYDLVLLTIMLFPAWLTGYPSSGRRIAAAALGLALAVLVVASGSRNVWLAVSGASAVAGLPAIVRWMRLRRQARIGALAVVVVAVALLVLVEPLRERALALTSFGQRWAMWSAIVDAWSRAPLAGYGPGSFPWILQSTNYFDLHTLAPRHPDSALFQLLGEAGVVGLIGGSALVVGLGRPLLRSRMTMAIWPVAVFLLGGIGANPSDIPYLVVVAIVWTALALPRVEHPTMVTIGEPPRLGWVLAGSLLVVVVAYGSTVLAGARYEAARSAASSGDLQRAVDELDSASALDPAMALYHRQAGTARLLLGETDAAISDLKRAVEINPMDDLAWRTLALAFDAGGNTDAALTAVGEAVDRQRSDVTNLLLSVSLANDHETDAEVTETLSEIVLAWPELVAAPGWADWLPDGISTGDAIELAIERWVRGEGAPGPIRQQPLLLTSLGHRPDLADAAMNAAGLPTSFRPAAHALNDCDPRAVDLLGVVPASDRADSKYWEMVIRATGEPGDVPNTAKRALQALSNRDVDPERGRMLLNPLHENDMRGYSGDRWGYRRLAIFWDEPDITLPDPQSGASNLLVDWSAYACP